MRKLFAFTILLILLGAKFAAALTCPPTLSWNQTLNGNLIHWYIEGHYASGAAAVAARTAWGNSHSPSLCGPHSWNSYAWRTLSNTSTPMYPLAGYSGWTFCELYWGCTQTAPYEYEYHIFMYPSDGVDSCSYDQDSDGDGVINMNDLCAGTPAGVSVDATGCPNDNDNDGLLNDMDPYEDDPTCFKFNNTHTFYCDSTIVGQVIQTDKGDEFHYGNVTNEDNSCAGEFHRTLNLYVPAPAGTDISKSYQYSCNDLPILLGEGSTVNSTDTAPVNNATIEYNADGTVKADNPNAPDGTAAGATDSENIASTTNNTDKIIDAINKTNEIEAGNQKVLDAILKQNASGSGAGTSTVGIESGIASTNSKLDTLQTGTTADGAAIPGLESDMTAAIENSEITPPEITEEMIEKNVDDNAPDVEEGLANIPLLNTTRIENSNETCNLEFQLSLLGQSQGININFCPYEWYVDLLGSFLMGWVTLRYIFLVFT